MSDFLKKIQNQPENVRKIMLWASLAVVGAILFGIWVFYSFGAINNLKTANLFEKMGIPSLKADIDKSIEGIKGKQEEIKQIKKKAEDILNSEELENILKEESKQ